MSKLKRPSNIPSEKAFRDTGYTYRAAQYPLSGKALRKKAAFNNVDPATVPDTWWFAPNKYMQDFWEGRRKI